MEECLPHLDDLFVLISSGALLSNILDISSFVEDVLITVAIFEKYS